MKKLLVLSALLWSVAVPAFAEGAEEFQLHNQLGQPITHVYASEVGARKWGPDLLSQLPIAKGDYAKLTFADRSDMDCYFDLKIVTEDGKNWLLPNLDACATNDLTLLIEKNHLVYRKN